MRVPVVVAVRSPLNSQRWCLVLKCGHELWVTSKRRPVCKTVKCPDCGKRESKEKSSGEEN